MLNVRRQRAFLQVTVSWKNELTRWAGDLGQTVVDVVVDGRVGRRRYVVAIWIT